MYKSISIYNFKALHKVENIRLNQITLIGGKNNSGKSTFLEAFFMYLDRRNVDLMNRQLGWRGITNIPIEPDLVWAPFFYQFDLQKTISIELLDEDNHIGRLSIKYKPDFSNKTPVFQESNPNITNQTSQNSKALMIKHETDSTEDERAHLLIDARGLGIVRDKNNNNLIPYAVIFPSRRRFESDDADRLGKLDLKNEQDKVIEILRIFEPTLKRLLSIKLGPHVVIHADIGSGRLIPIGLLGDGFCRSLSIILAIATNSNGVVFIDEIENGIHHSMLEGVWESIFKAAHTYSCQIVSTTHSYELIKSAVKKSFEVKYEDLSYVRFSKSGDSINAHQFTYSEISEALMSELEVR